MATQTKTERTPRPARREWHGTHHSWSYRPHAFRWAGEQIAGVNFVPLAKLMRAWLLRRGQLAILSAADQQKRGGCTNPYTFSGVALGLIMSHVVNTSHEYATKQAEPDDPLDAEIERLRSYNELLLYAARMCEVAIKQLLYCTQIPEARYKRMGLGALLESPCPSCTRKNGGKPHLVSLVGTLAHPFHLCIEFEHCAMDHMDLVNRLRNSQAAHSEIQTLHLRSGEESRSQLLSDSDGVLTGFVHMLSHLEKLEDQMLDDLAEKGEAITLLKVNGLAAKDCNFNLIPGRRFAFEPQPAREQLQSLD
jgi:hypothetical protein